MNDQINMVDISEKPPSKRVAKSQAKVELGEKLFNLIKKNQIEKGDLLTTAKLAGIQGEKLLIFFLKKQDLE